MPAIQKYYFQFIHFNDDTWHYTCRDNENLGITENTEIKNINRMLEKYGFINYYVNTIIMNPSKVFFLYFYIKYNNLSSNIQFIKKWSDDKYKSFVFSIEGDNIPAYYNHIVMLNTILKNNIYDYIDKLISKNPTMIKDENIDMIINNDLKIKYNHLIQASKFDLI